ncbi:MAG: hypothetical protein DPW09_09145 [Anaerolineae bacterium]|nr:hypothetical protein [Anaerolineales bacterium]MCQ3973594.1 hypothetical protein [Anaerolineae bacterium]
MKHADKWFLYAMIGGVILLLGAMMVVSAQPVSAQCGTSASSCKNCHETQGKLSVANNGDWHKAHAFGDFCEFCHAGNVQATAQDEAHIGMVAPLGDVKASCQGCHPDDYDPLAQTYASTLGVDLLAGGGGSANPPADSATGGDSSCTTGTTAVSAPLGGEEIDFNLLYAEATTPPPLISNWGNVILGLMILGIVGAFFVTAWSWENWGQTVAGWINKNVNPIPQAMAAAAVRSEGGLAVADPAQIETLLAQKPELQKLLPRLLKLSPETLTALDKLLSNPERGSEILTAISQVDIEVIATLRQLGAKEWGLLKALFKE